MYSEFDKIMVTFFFKENHGNMVHLYLMWWYFICTI